MSETTSARAKVAKDLVLAWDRQCFPEDDSGLSRYVDVPEAPGALAHALCQVALAVAGGK